MSKTIDLTMPHSHTSSEIKDEIRSLVSHLEHVLPGQAPIRDFVHHNTLHGFQHLHFDEALTAAEKINGAHGYQPESEFREYFRQGRITNDDLDAVMGKTTDLAANELIIKLDNLEITRRQVYMAALCHPLEAISEAQFSWQLQEYRAYEHFQDDVNDVARQQCMARARNTDEVTVVNQLANACLQALKLKHEDVHPEELLDLGIDQAEQILKNLASDDASSGQPIIHRLVRKEAEHILQQQIDRIGTDMTLRAFLRSVTGEDVLEQMLPLLIRHISLYLDQGMASWRHDTGGFYSSWKAFAGKDLAWAFDGIDEARDELNVLEDDAMNAIIHELHRLGLPTAKWTGYLEQLALEIPGWSGMFLWRHNHPGYEDLRPDKVDMLDYLAVRLVLERILVQQLSRKHWLLEPRIDVLRAYFRNHRSEFIVRYHLFNSQLPEYLVSSAQNLISSFAVRNIDYKNWIRLSDQFWTWRNSTGDTGGKGYSLYRHAWPLFILSQHLGLCADDIKQLDSSQISSIFETLDRLTANVRGFIWLQAYERNYREKLFNILVLNHGRGRWKTRESRPQAQIIFCMDEREESIRRHLEEHNPDIETLGAAGFFGVAINWQGIDDKKTTPLCPIVVTPSHNVYEYAPEQERYEQHIKRRDKRLWMQNLVHQELRRNIVSSSLLVILTAPFMLLLLVSKTLLPRYTMQFLSRLQTSFDTKVATRLKITADDPDQCATEESPGNGFTDEEQASRVEAFLQTVGLTSGFSQFPVMMGHGSGSQNNPHLAAYDCGACSGRHGGPNARVFAAMANRPEVRTLLSQRGLVIPEDTWFMGAEHNTCDDSIYWYDEDVMPMELRDAFEKLKQDMLTASKGSAHERCRRFASAPKRPDRDKALQHVISRSFDYSQARPELGHVTNAVALIGRRSFSHGAFFDRRAFLISYNPEQDAGGRILENILLAAGPVGAGINLEYYFSTVNNSQYGCGSKITHNVTGMFGVMDGASSDLRTGLPKQMVEIHEAMRLLVVVEAKTDVLAEIYNRQALLKELIGNGWLLLATIDPDNGKISMFEPGSGFVLWNRESVEVSTVNKSSDWYRDHAEPLPFALIGERSRG